ncbi:MAG: glutamate--tRNA ligase [Epsilonproteobacteria bacterium]|nr:glutamate--tRNA ligase [Campylobacterota bacterium]
MLRFALSPTADIDINDLKIALLTYNAAKKRNEEFIVRIEDLGQQQNISGNDQEALEILALFKIEYSQLIYQSKNIRFYSAMALQLLHEKKAFNCFCSNEWIAKKQQEAKEVGKPYMYDDACANLPAELVIDNENPFVVRIHKPDNNKTDSFIILHQEKTPTHDFASAVDDMLSDISLVITTDENKYNCEKQEYIRKQLGYDKKIEYSYVPKIQSEAPVSIKSLLELGILPEAIQNYLVSIEDAQSFDLEKLQEINRQVLSNLSNKELSRYVGFADDDIGALAKLYLKDVTTTKELKSKIKPIFEPREIPNELQKDYTALKDAIEGAPYFESYDAFVAMLMEKTNLSEDQLQKPLQIFLANTQDTPELAQVYQHLKNYLGELVKC